MCVCVITTKWNHQEREFTHSLHLFLSIHCRCPIDFLKSITLNCGTETEREHLRITLSDNNNTTGSGGGGGDGTNNGDKNLSKLCLESSAATETLVGQEFSDGQWVLHPLCQVGGVIYHCCHLNTIAPLGTRAAVPPTSCTVYPSIMFSRIFSKIQCIDTQRLPQGILAKLRRKSDEVASISPSSVEISVQFIATLKSEVRERWMMITITYEMTF